MPTIDDAILTVSDLHLSEGARLADGSENPQEDFLRDAEFAGLLTHAREVYADAHHLRLQLLGDIFDPLVVPIDGRFDPLPTESVCLEQMRRIINGHPVFFDALAEFLRDPKTEIVFFVGNHDFFIEWNAVQELLEERIAAGHSHRLRFSYREVHRGVLYTHGNFEPHNWIDEADRYVFPSRNSKVAEPILNYPYGSYMNAALMPKLRLMHPYMGRLRYHGFLYKEAATRNWRLAAYALWIGIGNFVRNRFFAFWDVRQKTGFISSLKIIWWTIFSAKQEQFAEEMMRKNPGVKAVVCGHDHKAREASLRSGKFMNTGTWSVLYDIRWHDKPNAPFGFRLLTRLATSISHLWHEPEFIRVEKLPVVVGEYGVGTAELKLMNWDWERKTLEPFQTQTPLDAQYSKH